MALENLQPAAGSTKNAKRIGRGQGSGKGGTAGKGHKGSKSRSGDKRKKGFEGGQMPLQRRIPKFGFKNINRVEYKAINLDALQSIAEANKISVIDVETLVKLGITTKNELVKVLGRGEISVKVDVKAHAFSKKASDAIVAAGGSIVKV